MTPRLHVGTKAANGGAGLVPLIRSAEAGWRVGAPFAGARNVSFAAYSARRGLHYLVDERSDGALVVLRATGEGWDVVGRLPTGGAEPCYVALDRAEDRLAVANYGSGSVATFDLADDGLPLAPGTMLPNDGGGPVAARQDGPHAHCACFDASGRWLYHVDLGTDEILAHPIDPTLGERRLAFAAPRGSGPRHLVFHPYRPLALLVSELANTLTLLAVGDGVLTALGSCSTLPPGVGGDSLAGHLSLGRGGERVYVTNRGHDSIAVFAWADGGMPAPMQHLASGGASPRAFVLLEAERELLLANEDAGTVTVFALRPDGGLAPHHETLSIPGALFPFVAPPPAR